MKTEPTHKNSAWYIRLARTEHFQPPISSTDLLHIRRETTLGISGLIHMELLGYEQLWLTVWCTDGYFDAHVHTL